VPALAPEAPPVAHPASASPAPLAPARARAASLRAPLRLLAPRPLCRVPFRPRAGAPAGAHRAGALADARPEGRDRPLRRHARPARRLPLPRDVRAARRAPEGDGDHRARGRVLAAHEALAREPARAVPPAGQRGPRFHDRGRRDALAEPPPHRRAEDAERTTL